MKIAIIGCGFTGLSAAFYLSKLGHIVTVYEAGGFPGGLAVGFKHKQWSWSLEKHYHHLFTSDKAILNLAEAVGQKILFQDTQSANFISDKQFIFDSPEGLLKFPYLNIFEKIRFAIAIFILKINPFWKIFEKYSTERIIKLLMGKKIWNIVWQPLMIGKFGKYSAKVSAVWFWARIYKRSKTLGYPEGGFLAFAKKIQKQSEKNGVRFYFNKKVNALSLSNTFDKIIDTVPHSKNIQSLGATNLVLQTKKPILVKTYWLNILENSWPFLAVVAHTNFISSKNYHDFHLTYFGKYQDSNSVQFNLDLSKTLKLYLPFIKKVNPDFKLNWITNKWLFKANFAQPIVDTSYAQKIPSMTAGDGVFYYANILQVYPWDRGTNYAVELGKKVAALCLKD